ncbi:YciI family protein [Nocardia sp. NPDC050435]|uniref:YciI family protein n=1 Tax=Nocardia sp. NPDC050435 TaxID=3155040 RepID=UPI0033D7F64B
MPQYFLTLPHNTADEPTMAAMQEMDPAELEALMAAVEKLNNDLVAAQALVHAGGLHPPSTAITVDATGATPTHTRAPFVEAPEYVGGFWIINADDEAAAIAWAEQASAAVGSRVEVRALQEEPGN